MDQDGDLDAVLVSERDDPTIGGTVHVLEGDGAGGFAPPSQFAVAAGPTDLLLADLNDDGPLDLAVSNYGEGSQPGGVEIRLGDGVAGFGPVVSSQVVPAAYSMAVGDFNEDGHPDLVRQAFR